MILSHDHTYIKRRREAVLPDRIINRLVDKYLFFPKAQSVPERFEAVKNLNNHLQFPFGEKADLVTEWMVKTVSQSNARWPEDFQRLQQAAISYFRSIKEPRYKQVARDFLADFYDNPESVNIKNILHFSLHTLESINDLYEKPQEDPRVNELQAKLPEGAELFYNDGNYQIVQVTSSQAACVLGKGTKWCTSGEGPAEYYLSQGPLYIIYLKGKKYAQLHIGKETQFMDLKDRPLKVDDPLREILIKSGLTEKIFANSYDMEPRNEFLEWIGFTPAPYKEDLVLKNPWWCFYYAELSLRGRFQRGEPVILKNIYLACTYAEEILKDRWLEAEPLIIKSGRRYLQGYLKFLKRIGKLHEFKMDHNTEIEDLY